MRKLLAVVCMMLALLGASTYPAMAQDDATPAASPARQGASNPIDPTVGDSVSLTDARGEEYALATVTEVIRPWEDYSEFEEPDRGTEYVGIVLEVENTSDDPVEVDPFDFLLQDAGGFSFGTAFAQGAEELEMAPLTEATEVEGGETGEFLLVFNVFEDQGLAHLFWQPETGRLITLAQLEDE